MRISAVLAAGLAFASAPALAGDVQELSSKSADFMARHEATGETRSCLMLRQVETIRALDERLILVTVTGGEVYLSQAQSSCGRITPRTRFQHATSSSSLCAGDVLQNYENYSNIFMGACALGEFEKLQPKSADAPA